MSHNFSYEAPEVLGVSLQSEKCRDLGMAQPAESYGKGKAPVSLKEKKKRRRRRMAPFNADGGSLAESQ